MANIKITELEPNQVEFAELSSSELEAIMGGFRFLPRPPFLRPPLPFPCPPFPFPYSS